MCAFFICDSAHLRGMHFGFDRPYGGRGGRGFGGGRGRGRRGRGRGGRSGRKDSGPQKTQEELDAELDQYIASKAMES